jgi:hypothetical protein
LSCWKKRKQKIESSATKFKKLGGPEMDNQKWEAIVKDWRKVPSGKSNKVVKSRRVRCNYKGETGGKEGGEAVRSAA